MRNSWGRGHSKGRQRPATTEGLPSLAALGLAGGDGTEPADPLAGLSDQARVRHRELDRLRAVGTERGVACSALADPSRTSLREPAVPPGVPPLTLLPGPFG
ncbi:hypothetical protein [Streptomyces coeruleorubidus]|uniref:hypothetical protein n=1 Tax=Streptomyces coeruleorubidus TaxID=116188 RepID=UPI0033DFB421